jgi:chromosome segregation ATPase
MDLEPILPWLGAIALIVTLVKTVYDLLTRGSDDNAEELKKLGDKITDHDRRIQQVENELKHLPDQKAVHDLALALKDMQAEIVKIASSAEQSARTSKRIEDYLMSQKKGGG